MSCSVATAWQAGAAQGLPERRRAPSRAAYTSVTFTAVQGRGRSREGKLNHPVNCVSLQGSPVPQAPPSPPLQSGGFAKIAELRAGAGAGKASMITQLPFQGSPAACRSERGSGRGCRSRPEEGGAPQRRSWRQRPSFPGSRPPESTRGKRDARQHEKPVRRSHVQGPQSAPLVSLRDAGQQETPAPAQSCSRPATCAPFPG